MAGPTADPAPSRNPAPAPDFRNLGTLLRAAVLAEGIRLLALLGVHGHPAMVARELADGAAWFETALLASLLALFIAAPMLARWNFRDGLLAASAVAAGMTALVHAGLRLSLPDAFNHAAWHGALVAGGIAALVMGYFHWRYLALSPALAHARLTALQSRIRPHFLFNSLNSVLGLLRADPRRAETLLENLAELFRALMANADTLVSLEHELALARAYVEIESLRLGERLHVRWFCDDAPLRARVPQLILQPLVENAVLHGIEPAPQGGLIEITVVARQKHVLMVVKNPLVAMPEPPDGHAHPSPRGNRMAMSNIRERLDLHFDAEARMTHFVAGGQFTVQIEIPLV